MKIVKAITVFSMLLLILSGCSTSQSNVLKKSADGEVIHDRFTIKPSRSYEECIEVKPGMVFDYDFDASDFVNFNVHYHAEDDVHYPVSKKGVRMGMGNIDPDTLSYYTEEQEFFCLMWDNVNDEPVKVRFKCVLKKN